MLSRIIRQIIYALLTRAPLSSPRRMNHVRLACVRHAASVRSEPGSNSPVYTEKLNPFFCFKETSLEPTIHGVYYLVFKDQACCPFRCGRIGTLTNSSLPVNYFFQPAIFFRKNFPAAVAAVSVLRKSPTLHASIPPVNFFFLLRFFFQKPLWLPLQPNR